MAEPPDSNLQDLFRLLMQVQVPPEVRRPVHDALRQRGNTPGGVEAHMARRGQPRNPNKLWIVDRILEPQTISHFLEFLSWGELPSGRRTDLTLLTGREIRDYLTSQPYSAWAPAPFSSLEDVPLRLVMDHIGSFADAARLHCVTKELHAMKSRLWEGTVPLSERRWREKKLDAPENFSAACQLLSAAVNVFHYLNHERVRSDLRETYNLIWDRLKTFETAVNLVRAAESKSAVSVTSLWAEYMRDHYDVMVNRAHSWVVSKVERLLKPVVEALGTHQPTNPPAPAPAQQFPFPPDFAAYRAPYDDVQWDLTNKLHDLVELRAHADFAIFMPTDGYRGFPTAEAASASPDEADDLQKTGMVPLVFTPDPLKRRERYVTRLKVLSREHMMANVLMGDFLRFATTGTAGGGPRAAHNSPVRMVQTADEQIRAQEKAGRELRGEPMVCETEAWVRGFKEYSKWGFVCYRVAGLDDAEWVRFQTRFERDVAEWGEELKGVEEIRARPMFHWIDAKEHGLGGDVAGLKRHFATFVGSGDFPSNFQDSVFLVADEFSVQSYMDPLPESMPPGDNGGSILAVDTAFDPSYDYDESPAYDGMLRILGSLLWDELSVFLLRQAYRLEELWPLAMKHPWGVYVGDVVPRQDKNWRLLFHLRLAALTQFQAWKRRQGPPGSTETR